MRASILFSLSAIALSQSAFAQMLSQIGDGQVQAAVGTSTLAAATTAGLVSQISDHQPQAPATTSEALTPSATTESLVSQISDHQPQAPATTSIPVASATTVAPQSNTSMAIFVSSSSRSFPSLMGSFAALACLSLAVAFTF